MVKKIAIVSASTTETADGLLEKFIDAINDEGDGVFDCDLYYFRNLMFSLGKSNECKDIPSGHSLFEYDFVLIKTIMGFEEEAVTLAYLLREKNVAFLCEDLITKLVHSKIGEGAILATAGIPVPTTLFFPTKFTESIFNEITDRIGLPFVWKSTTGTKGRSNYLIHDKKEFEEANKMHSNEKFVAQEFIANSGDYRVLMVQGDAKLIFKRSRTNRDLHLNNPSLGAKVAKVSFSDFSAQVQQICIKSTEVLGRDIAGIDLVFRDDDPSRPYVFEVNASPQMISGSFMDEKVTILSDLFKSI